jgi:hypothetical protein
MMGTIRRVTGNVKHWRNAKMALRWTAAGMMEAKKSGLTSSCRSFERRCWLIRSSVRKTPILTGRPKLHSLSQPAAFVTAFSTSNGTLPHNTCMSCILHCPFRIQFVCDLN